MICMCCIETFGRKHSHTIVSHRHENNLSIQSTDIQWLGRVTGSKASGSGRVGSGHGSKVQTRFHLWYCPHQSIPRSASTRAPLLTQHPVDVTGSQDPVYELLRATWLCLCREPFLYSLFCGLWLLEMLLCAMLIDMVCGCQHRQRMEMVGSWFRKTSYSIVRCRSIGIGRITATGLDHRLGPTTTGEDLKRSIAPVSIWAIGSKSR